MLVFDTLDTAADQGDLYRLPAARTSADLVLNGRISETDMVPVAHRALRLPASSTIWLARPSRRSSE